MRALRSTIPPTCHALTTATIAHSAMAAMRRCSLFIRLAAPATALPAIASSTATPIAVRASVPVRFFFGAHLLRIPLRLRISASALRGVRLHIRRL